MDPSGNSVTYKYDAVGNLLAISSASAPQVAVIQFSPSSGPVGTQVTIYGAGFSSTPANNTVTFTGASGVTPIAATTTALVVAVPSGATSGTITVTAPSGSATSSASFTVTVTGNPGPPTITGFSPTSGAAGTSVTITGTNFQTAPSNNAVAFNLEQGSVTAASATSLTVAVPANATSGPISVTTPYGQAVSSADFFVPPPSLPAGYTGVDAQAAFTNNTSTSNFTLSVNQSAVVAFAATQGERALVEVTFNLSGGSSPSGLIYNPDGSILYSSGSGNQFYYSPALIETGPLPETGTYTIVVSPQNNTSGTVTVAITLFGSPASGSLSIGGPPLNLNMTPGQQIDLTFSGVVGQTIVFDYLANGGADTVGWYILNPDQSLLSGTGAVTLAQTGTYNIWIDPGGVSGSLSAQLYNLTPLASTVPIGDSYATAILADHPFAYWRLDDQVPATAVDAIPPITYKVAGPTTPDTAISLNNYGAHLTTQNAVTVPQIYTLEAWFNTSASNGLLIGFTGDGYSLSLEYGGHLYWGGTVSSPGTYNDAQWHYVVAASDGVTGRLYVDGSLVASGSVAAGTRTGYWQLGNGPGFVPVGLHAALSEVAVYAGTALSGTQVQNHYSARTTGNYDAVVLSDGPTGYWKLNETDGTNFTDSSGRGDNGVLVQTSPNGTTSGGVTNGVSGAISGDTAMSFAGSPAQIIATTYSTKLPLPSVCSLEVWFKNTAGSAGSMIVGSSPAFNISLAPNSSGQVVFSTYKGSITSPGVYSNGSWHHAVGILGLSSIKLYIDGALAASGSFSGTVPGEVATWFIGSFFNGSLDEPALYDYALSATQVLNHYNAQHNGTLEISSFAPGSGSAGTSVTISGTGFNTQANLNTVKFNGVQAGVSSATATSINTSVPSGATSGPLTVTTSTLGTATK